jgi:hypothetical protein
MRALLATILAGLTLALTATPAHADETEASSCLRTKVWDGYGDGWAIRTMTSTELEAGKTRSYLVSLYADNEYRITTCADTRAKNLDVLIYDTEGNIVVRDETTDREPSIDFKPTASGTYYVVVYLREAAEGAEQAGVAMAVVYR